MESPFFARDTIRQDRSTTLPFGISRISGLNEALEGYGYGCSPYGSQVSSREAFDWLLDRVDDGEFVLLDSNWTTPMSPVLRWSTGDNSNGYRVPLLSGSKDADYTQGRWRADSDLPMQMRSRIDECLEKARRSDRGPEHLWWGGFLVSKRGGGGGAGAGHDGGDEIASARPENRRRENSPSRGQGAPPTAGAPLAAGAPPANAPPALTTAAGLATPATPADAPATINLSGMQNHFDAQWNNSFPNGKSQEHGGTIVSDASGNLSMVNMGGGERGSFSPNFNVDPGQKIQGVFHTHPYDASEGGDTGVSLSGGDIGNLINDKRRQISVVQSGTDQFMCMRTGTTPASVNAGQLNRVQNARIAELQTVNGKSFSEASQIAARETAQAHGLAYYEGSNGVFQRVYP